jgi:hypothetical protein
MEDRVFTPKFIPIYTDIRDKYKLSIKDAQTFGFIKFYVTSTGNQFYFGDEAMMRILGYKKLALYRSLENLENKGLIKTYTTNENGTKRRYIHLQDLKNNTITVVSKTILSQYQKRYHNNNNQNIINNKVISEQELFDFLNGNTKSDKLPELPF